MEINTVRQDLGTQSMKIDIYQPHDKQRWDEFVQGSKNGHFLFHRDYMEYHSDRFQDSSLLVSNDKGHLIALLPAHRQGSQCASHQGLTYGGFVTNEAMKAPVMLEVFEATTNFLRKQSFTSFVYKTIPHIHHRLPAEEDRYALFRMGARLFRRNVFSVISQNDRIPFQERRKRSIHKAKQTSLVTLATSDFPSYWSILTDVLWETHHVKPVHTLSEIQYLTGLFPAHIKLYGCFFGAKMLAGVVVYETEAVARFQYIAASLEGKSLGALDLVFDTLINETYRNKKHIDFGPSDENNGLYLNIGLIEQKEGFGARSIVHDHYEVNL